MNEERIKALTAQAIRELGINLNLLSVDDADEIRTGIWKISMLQGKSGTNIGLGREIQVSIPDGSSDDDAKAKIAEEIGAHQVEWRQWDRE